ncbi:MAG: phytoene/squalene synthase family protein, partial [Bacteroidota bacterium]
IPARVRSLWYSYVDLNNFSLLQKKQIEKEIEKDFQEAYKGIVQLKREARLGVYIAYIYYRKLFCKIKQKSPNDIMQQRIRISNWTKIALLFRGLIRHEFDRV